ncbi:unnamed protein product, partial [Prorocentrum cordatum]
PSWPGPEGGSPPAAGSPRRGAAAAGRPSLVPIARITAGAAAGLLLAAVWRGDGSVGFTGPRLRQRAVATALAAEVRSSPLLADLLAFAASESDEGKVAARVDGDFGGLAPEDPGPHLAAGAAGHGPG